MYLAHRYCTLGFHLLIIGAAIGELPGYVSVSLRLYYTIQIAVDPHITSPTLSVPVECMVFTHTKVE